MDSGGGHTDSQWKEEIRKFLAKIAKVMKSRNAKQIRDRYINVLDQPHSGPVDKINKEEYKNAKKRKEKNNRKYYS